MDNQGTRDDLSGRSKPVGTFAGAATPGEATAVGEPIDVAPGVGGTPGTSSLDATMASFAGQPGEQAGIQSQPGQATDQGASGSGGTMGKVDAGIEKAAGGIDKLVDVIRDRGQDLGQASGPAGTVGSVATAAADRLEGASQYLHQTDTDRLMADIEALVRRKPVESLLVAAGLGFVFAKALR